jgi:hypothetical protein
MSRVQLLSNPKRYLIEEVFPFIPLVGEYHQAVIIFRAENSAYTLACLPHCIEAQKVLISDTVVFIQELHTST